MAGALRRRRSPPETLPLEGTYTDNLTDPVRILAFAHVRKTIVHNRKSLPFFREKGQDRRTALESAHRAIAPSRHRAIAPSRLAFFCSFRDSVATHCSHVSGLGIIAYGNSKYRKGCGACEALRPWYEWRASVERRNRCGLRVDAKGHAASSSAPRLDASRTKGHRWTSS